jgi:hypothetical protein
MKFDAVLFQENSFVGVFLFRKNDRPIEPESHEITPSEENLRANVLQLFDGMISMHPLREHYDQDRALVYEGLKHSVTD